MTPGTLRRLQAIGFGREFGVFRLEAFLEPRAPLAWRQKAAELQGCAA